MLRNKIRNIFRSSSQLKNLQGFTLKKNIVNMMISSSSKFFSSDSSKNNDEADSHDDFKPKSKISLDLEGSDINKIIGNMVSANRVFLFMKGTKSSPACGFSYQIVSLLHLHGVEFETADVLSDAELREGIKSYTDWPTLPQLYVDGEFVGGFDIVSQMHQDGELKELFEEKKLIDEEQN